MVGAWSGLDNRPVAPGIQHGDREPSAPQVLTVVVGGTAGQSGPGTAAESGERRDAPWRPNPSGKAATDHPNYLRTAQVAALLYVSPKTVSRWAKEGKLPFLKTLGGHRRYPEAGIRELAEELREEAMS